MNAAPVWELSGWWRRVGAYILDSIIVGLLVLAPIAIAYFATGVDLKYFDQDNLDIPPSQEAAIAVFVVVALLSALIVPAVYYCWIMVRTDGQTVGKQATDIRVVREDGQKVTAGFAFVRQILVIEVLFGFVGGLIYIAQPLDFLWALWDGKNQCLHDKIVKSRVVRARQVVPQPGHVPPQPYFSPGAEPARPAYQQEPGQPYYGPLTPDGRPAAGQPQFPQAPAGSPPPPPPSSVPPPPPAPGGPSTPYTPPAGFENPVPEDKQD